MKLSRAAWNNVIIICVISMILLINLTNDRLFPDQQGLTSEQGEHALLGPHAVILTLSINDKVFIERLGQAWRVSSPVKPQISQQLIEQTVQAWQQSRGLPQATSIEIKGMKGIPVTIFLAGHSEAKQFWLYLLSDQLLIKEITGNNQEQWVAFPPAIYRQLMPKEFERI